MNRTVMLALLHLEFPDKNIVCIPNNEDPKEIIVELERAPDDSYSIALALIDESEEHRNPGLKEDYLVEAGRLVVYIDKKMVVLETGQDLTIDGEQRHSAISPDAIPARVRVTSRPAWKPEHHVLV